MSVEHSFICQRERRWEVERRGLTDPQGTTADDDDVLGLGDLLLLLPHPGHAMDLLDVRVGHAQGAGHDTAQRIDTKFERHDFPQAQRGEGPVEEDVRGGDGLYPCMQDRMRLVRGERDFLGNLCPFCRRIARLLHGRG